MQLNQISMDPFKRALQSLSQVLAETKTDYIRDASIQRFEYTFELAWKLLKRYIEANNGILESNVKNIFREAAKQGLIESFEAWEGYLKARNLTSHTYEMATAELVYQQARQFEKSAIFLAGRLEKLLA